MKINDKVFVSNWGKLYSDVFKWIEGQRVPIWPWKTEIPIYSSPMHFHERKYKPKLTVQGKPYKDGSKELISDIPAYKDYEYTVLEKTTRNDGKVICLLSSEKGCYVQIEEEGLTSMTPEEQIKVAHLENSRRLQALAKDNLGKWSIKSDRKLFPKELLKYLYDRNQTTQFGRGMTKAIIKYPYIAKEYTVNGNDLCLGWEQLYNGKGCDLSGKETIVWSELPKRFPENSFQ